MYAGKNRTSNAVVGYGNPAAKTADTPVAYGEADNERLSMKMSSLCGDRGGPVRAEFAAVAEQGPEHVDEAAGQR